MKTRKYIYTTLATCLFVFSSCLNDLDVLPLDPTVETADKAYTDAESYTKGPVSYTHLIMKLRLLYVTMNATWTRHTNSWQTTDIIL